MSDTEINIQKVLSVFDVITKQGERHGDEYQYQGLRAHTDFDGYTIFIENDYVCLTVFFHNKFSLESSSQKEKMLFLNKIDEIHAAKKKR